MKSCDLSMQQFWFWNATVVAKNCVFLGSALPLYLFLMSMFVCQAGTRYSAVQTDVRTALYRVAVIFDNEKLWETRLFFRETL
jgi:hypothetical protein